MRKMLCIAAREFSSTVMTRAFVIGWLITPVMMAVVLFAIPRLIGQSAYRTRGEIAVIDPTHTIGPALEQIVEPKNLEARRLHNMRAALDGANRALASGAGRPPAGNMAAAFAAAAGLTLTPQLHVVEEPADADPAKAQSWLLEPAPPGARHLALAVIHPQAAVPADSQSAASDPSPHAAAYDLYVAPNLDDRAEGAVRGMLRDAIVSVRARAYGLDLERLDDLTRIVPGKTMTLTRNGRENSTVPAFDRLVPFALIFFLIVGVLGGGQFLLTTMVEEKSSRIIEVLLSAVSPLELLAGKIAGQLAAGMVGMTLYLLMALAGLTAFALFGLVDPALLLYLFLFFVISFLVVGSVMVAVGASVNELRDAQSLLTPFMLLLAAMWIVVMPISLSPNSPLAVTLSFTPVLSTFAMIVRMASTAPPPLWQVWLSIAVGIGSAAAAVWFAAKIFRIALLLQGRPPTLKTLLRWAVSS